MVMELVNEFTHWNFQMMQEGSIYLVGTTLCSQKGQEMNVCYKIEDEKVQLNVFVSDVEYDDDFVHKNWFLLEEEVIGTTSDMSWMSNERGDKALFKPDESGDDYLIELNVYRLATFFDIPYSRVLPFTLNNIDGFLSIVEDTRRYHRINGSDLYRNGKKYTSKAVSAGKTNYDDDIDYSLKPSRE